MFWLAIPAIVLGKIAYDAVTDRKHVSVPTYTVFERNLFRLESELSGIKNVKVGIIGQPGAGKSSLLKKMTKGRVRPLPVIGTETDATSWSESPTVILQSKFNHFNFVDVPGYDTVAHPVTSFKQYFPFDDFDAYIFVVRGKLRAADEAMFDSIRSSNKPVCLARSFAESCNEDERDAISIDLQKRLGLSDNHHIGFFSNRSGEGIADIMNAIIGCTRPK